jgi:glutaminyl-peptide cyclotransferase
VARTPPPKRPSRAKRNTAIVVIVLLVASVLAVLVRPGASSAGPRPFSGARAFEYARTQTDFGPRVPGTEAHRRAGDWIAQQMRQRADTVIEQRWTHVTARGDSVPLRNILARFRPQATDRVLYVAHWDSRPNADRSVAEADRTKPVLGANDGASGVGLLIALADVLRATSPNVGVDLLFVDGEDFGEFGPPQVDVLLGSTYFADHLPAANYQPLFGIVFDMIGDRDLRIQQEGHSIENAPEVVRRVWQVAAELGHGAIFVNETTTPIADDHVPLQQRGLRVIDLIDIDYAGADGTNYHHTLLDTMDKISAASLQAVGDVAVALVTAR